MLVILDKGLIRWRQWIDCVQKSYQRPLSGPVIGEEPNNTHRDEFSKAW